MNFLANELKKLERYTNKKELRRAILVLYYKLDGFFNPKARKVLREFALQKSVEVPF